MGLKQLSVVLLVVTGLGACTHVYDVPVTRVEHVQREKLNLKVALQLSEELRNARWERHMMGDTFIIPLGDAFAENSQVLARALFSEVVVTDGTRGPAQGGINAVLIPRMVSVHQTLGAWAWGDQVMSVIFEWTMKDANGNTVWVDTITGEAQAHGGNLFTHQGQTEKRVKALVEDLFRKSFRTMSSAAAIRDFVSSNERR